MERIAISLKYGTGEIPINIPRKNLLAVFEQKIPSQTSEPFRLIQHAVQSPLNAVPLEQWARGKHLLILLSDATREVPNVWILQNLLPVLHQAKFFQVLITTGTHSWDSPDNLQLKQQLIAVLKSQPVPFKVSIHNATATQWVDLGKTPAGTPIQVNTLIQEAEHILIISDVKPHYFGGYSNVVKHIVPGICSLTTAERDHSWSLDPRSRAVYHPWHKQPQRRDNPLAKDMVDAFQRIVQGKSVWALGIITYHNHLLWAAGGHPQEVMQAAFEQADRWMAMPAIPADALIVSPGGYPHDESLYIAQRALELSRPALKSGGRLLFVSECRNGIGSSSAVTRFYEPLLPENRKLLTNYTRENYTLYIHKPIRLWRLIQETQFLGMKTALAPNLLQNIHIAPVGDVQKTLEQWIRENPEITINVVKDGNKLALYAGYRRAI